jgi:phenylalanyl-tRNA synthetase alpha chain
MELHPQAQELLWILTDRGAVDLDELEADGEFDNAMRPAQWLAEEELVEIEEERTTGYALTDEGRTALREGLPEERVLELAESGATPVSEVRALGDIGTLGIGKAREKGLVTIADGLVSLTPKGREMLDAERPPPERRSLENIEDGRGADPGEDVAAELLDRGLIRTEESVSRRVVLTENGKQIDESDVTDKFDVEVPAADALSGRKHFARQVYDYIRRVWVEMGFEEMNGPLVVPSLLNFDGLFTPQDHPARELHDTFFVNHPQNADLQPYGPTVDWIGQTHEDGWETGSDGWGYDWDRDEARKNVLRTHTTAVSAMTLWEMDEDDLPAKFFSIGRNFRNETVDWKHLAEFNQSEGIVVSHDVDFQHLKGYLRQFFTRLGYGDVRLRPAYYPYTELSVEVDVYDSDQEEWVGLGGAGMFRPEVVKPLIGFEVPVLAWGLGPGRIIMRHHDITDMREMYRNDLELLRNATAWVE